MKWTVIYRTNEYYTQTGIPTYEQARIKQEMLIRTKNPYWTALVREKRGNVQL